VSLKNVNNLTQFTIYTAIIFFSYLTDFSYFCEQKNPKVAGHGQNRSKITCLKGDVDGFSYFFK